MWWMWMCRWLVHVRLDLKLMMFWWSAGVGVVVNYSSLLLCWRWLSPSMRVSSLYGSSAWWKFHILHFTTVHQPMTFGLRWQQEIPLYRDGRMNDAGWVIQDMCGSLSSRWWWMAWAWIVSRVRKKKNSHVARVQSPNNASPFWPHPFHTNFNSFHVMREFSAIPSSALHSEEIYCIQIHSK